MLELPVRLIEYQKNFKGKSGFCANVYVVNGLQSENFRGITKQI